tara:strand:+ start:281 stop:400 length:120 start_codon:yes stop_codon:yes gene_type:complete
MEYILLIIGTIVVWEAFGCHKFMPVFKRYYEKYSNKFIK